MLILPVELLQHIFSYCNASDLVNLSCCSRSYKESLEPFVWQSVSIPLREIKQKHFTTKKNRAEKLKHVRMLRLGSCPSGLVFNKVSGGLNGNRIQAGLHLLDQQNCMPTVLHTSLVPSSGCGLANWNLLENVVELYLYGVHLKNLSGLKIRKLSIITNKGVTASGIILLRGLTNLTILHFGGDSVLSFDEMKAFGTLVQLTELVITKSQIQSEALVELKTLLKLEKLVVRDCLELVLPPRQRQNQGMYGLDDQILSHLNVLINLRHLDVNLSKDITDKGLVHISKFVNLQTMDLSHCSLVTDWGIEHITDLQLLEQLFVKGCDLGLTYLHRFGNLVKLSVQVSNTGLFSISRLVHLKHLFIWSSSISTKVGLCSLSQLVNLESIIFHNMANYLGDEVLAAVSLLPKLKVLHLGQPQAWVVSERGFKYFTKMSHLEELKLTVQQLDDDALLYVTSSNLLNHLDINSNQGFSHVGISYISQLSDLKHLRAHLCFDFNDECLFHINMLAELQTLDISNCWAVTDYGLMNLVKLTNLRTLNIGHCKGITNRGLRHMQRLTKLVNLDISGLQINDTGLVHIGNILNLKRLWLVSCGHITMKGIHELQKLKHLQKLHLTNSSQFLGEALAEVKKILPYANVIYALRN